MALTIEDFGREYSRVKTKRISFFLLAAALLILLAMVGITLGSGDLSFMDSYGAFWDGFLARMSALFGTTTESVPDTPIQEIIIWDIRLHRVLFALVAGFGLAIAGTIMQGILRNPLASPFTLGISSAASCGASVAIILFAGVTLVSGNVLVVIMAFLFAMTASFIIYGMARHKGLNSSSLILAGIAIMYLFSAITSLIQYFGSSDQAAAVVYWMFGSLEGTTWPKLLIVTAVIAILTPYTVMRAWDLNALAEGDEIAKSIGVPVERTMTVFMMIASIITAVIIAFTGTIGFIGLVAPHITRMAIGNDHRWLVPASGLVGAAILLGADNLCRTLIYPSVIPVGIMTAFLGVPFFLYLFMKRGDTGW
ncbi:iron ABC transporter permease [Methanogenium sp. S4BF]|uniref:FecCD family ABC transporter permease n=1 Tax=Methanogenium sp. S4BF TaxID=1789226 RepID=UPI00241604D0|nr:iron ABC transporter permease [Methanogenium sp. S4BF]WFN34318.1 iron ABC transporter permease [Methanogenium sp. S4BF]